MEIETLDDVLSWTKKFHQHLSQCLSHCSSDNDSERSRLLLGYLAEHEKHLTLLLQEIQNTAKSSALMTWCQEYINKHPIDAHEKCHQPFARLTTNEISETIFKLHSDVIELYRFLLAQAGAPSAIELLQQLLDLEEHEAMQMANGTNQLEDL